MKGHSKSNESSVLTNEHTDLLMIFIRTKKNSKQIESNPKLSPLRNKTYEKSNLTIFVHYRKFNKSRLKNVHIAFIGPL